MEWEHTSVNMELSPLRAAPGTPSDSKLFDP